MIIRAANRFKLSKADQKGFTILELMIATTVLTVILLLVTVMITGIGNLYYKGITLSQTQDTTRNIADQVIQDIKLNDKPPTTPTSAVFASKTVYAQCVGTVRYSYIPGVQIGTDVGQIQHVIWRDSVGSGSTCTPVNLTLPTPSVGGSELLGHQSRLTAFSINASPSNVSLFVVQVGVAFGDTDLLIMAGLATQCRGITGNQFCATDSLTTSAIQRISGGS